MPFIKLSFKPGVNRDTTDYANEGGWYACEKVRFRSGYPQKLGGWSKQIDQEINGRSYQMMNWVTTYSDNFLAIGTHTKLYIQVGTDLYDITPFRSQEVSPATDDCLTFTQDSNVVTVTLAGHGATTGDTVVISGVAAGAISGELAGIPLTELNTSHVITVTSSSTFTFTTTTAANIGLGYGIGTWGDGLWGIGGASTTYTGGGTAIVIDFEINIGYPITTYGYGWGTSTWGRGTWGSGSVQPVFLEQRDWWLDNFDNDLVANIRNGAIYYWERGTNPNPTTALADRAVLLSTLADNAGYDPDAVPVKVMQCLVSQNDKHLIAFGAVPYSSTDPDDFDPLLIRWANQDDPFQWTPSPTNSAGDLRISRGSEIVRALPSRQEILVWTNSNLYSLQFLGTTDVFGLQELADNISIIGPRAPISANNVTYWMGADKFYMYNGRVDTLPCTLMEHVFQNLNFNQADQIVAGTNEQWNEVWWFYPSADSDYNDSYVIYNHREQIWYYGTIDRTAWLDSPLRSYPQAIYTDNTTQNGTLYFHENSVDGDGAPIVSYIQSSNYDISEGDNFALTRRIIPDVSFAKSTAENPQVTLTLQPQNFPGSAVINSVGNSKNVIQTAVNQYTNQVFIRARARQMAFKISSEDLGVQWQLGAPRVDTRTDGKR